MPSANRSRIPVLTKIIPVPLPTATPTPDNHSAPSPITSTPAQSNNVAVPTESSLEISEKNQATIDLVALADEAVQKVMPALLAEFQMKLRGAVREYVKAALQKQHE